MKQLIAATIDHEASLVWNSWPKKSAEFGYPGRSAKLSDLLIKSGSMPAHIEALKLRESLLLSSLAASRDSLVIFLRLTPPIDATRRQKLRLQIDDIQDKTHGTIYYNYGISSEYLDQEDKS